MRTRISRTSDCTTDMRKVRSSRCVSCIEELVLAVVPDILSSVMVQMSKIMVVDTEAEEAPLQGRMKELQMQGKKGACMDPSWGENKEEYASSITGPYARPRTLNGSLFTRGRDP
jgi:hypothetical protein